MFGLFRRRAATPLPIQRRRLTSDVPAVLYAIGDIHGCFDQLQDLLGIIADDARDITGRRMLVTLGDYVDRGPKSASVLDWVCGPAPEGFERVSLAGNHEVMMLDFLDNPNPNARWLEFGGNETLASYVIDARDFGRASPRERRAILQASIPQEHIDVLRDLPGLLEMPGAVFVHAGIRPGIALAEQDDEDLMWIREPFVSTAWDDGPVLVHGHTPAVDPVVSGRRICVDTGAFATGVLTAVRMAGSRISFLNTKAHPQQVGR